MEPPPSSATARREGLHRQITPHRLGVAALFTLRAKSSRGLCPWRRAQRSVLRSFPPKTHQITLILLSLSNASFLCSERVLVFEDWLATKCSVSLLVALGDSTLRRLRWMARGPFHETPALRVRCPEYRAAISWKLPPSALGDVPHSRCGTNRHRTTSSLRSRHCVFPRTPRRDPHRWSASRAHREWIWSLRAEPVPIFNRKTGPEAEGQSLDGSEPESAANPKCPPIVAQSLCK